MIVDSTNPRIMADNIRELARNGGRSDLPDVTAADNGKILGVVEGFWNKMDASSGGVNYSTNEQDTGLTWLDGSKIYQKTISVDNLDYGGTRSVNHGIENFGNIINVQGIGSIDHSVKVLPYTQGTIQTTIRIDGFDNTTFNVTIGNGFVTNLTNCAFTLMYTKTSTTKSKKKTTKGEN